MPSRQYLYKIREIYKINDGDSFWAYLDVGFRQTNLTEIRLDGYDCPERRKGSAFEKSEGLRALSLTTEFLEPPVARPGASLWVRTDPDPDSFGRWLGDIWLESDGDQWPERHLGAELRSHGLASLWPTRWRDEFDAAV